MPKTFGWSPNLGGSTEEQYVRNTYYNAGNFMNELSDFNSPYYQQFRSYLSSSLPKASTDSILGTLAPGGGTNNANTSVALKLRRAYDKDRADKINQGVAGFALNNINQIGGLFQTQAGLATSAYDTKTQKDIAEMQQPGVLDYLSAPLGVGLQALTFGSGFGGRRDPYGGTDPRKMGGNVNQPSMFP